MTTTAINAQGSTFSIGTASGSANNITAVALTNPCRITLTSSVSGLSVGDVITIAGISGTTQLNGNSYVVQYIEAANKIITLAGVNALAFTPWSSGGTVTPVVLTPIANVTTFSGFDGSPSELPATNLSSTAMEFIAGLDDEGSFSFEVDYDGNDPGQLACQAAKVARATKTFKLVLPDGHTATFSAMLTKFPLAGGINQIAKRSCALRITGSVTRA